MTSDWRIRCTMCKEGRPPKDCQNRDCYMWAYRFAHRQIPVAGEVRRRYNTGQSEIKEGDKR